MASAGARAYNGSLGAEVPVESMAEHLVRGPEGLTTEADSFFVDERP